MKHIGEILAARRESLKQEREYSLFAASPEKGSAEWSTFNTVRDDSAGFYKVRRPKKPIVVCETSSARIFRIVYPARPAASVR